MFLVVGERSLVEVGFGRHHKGVGGVAGKVLVDAPVPLAGHEGGEFLEYPAFLGFDCGGGDTLEFGILGFGIP